MGKERESANLVSTLTGIAVTISGDPVILGVGNTELVRVTGSGSVGIGTTNPQDTLSVRNSTGWALIDVRPSLPTRAAENIYRPPGEPTSDNPEIFIGKRHPDSDDGKLHIWRYNGSSHQPSDFVLNSSGRVGIGTTTVDALLHVHNGDFRVTDAAKTNRVEMTTDGNIEIKRSGGGAYIDFADSTSDDYDVRIQEDSNGIQFKTGGSGSTYTRLNIASDGVITGRGELRLTQGTSAVSNGAEFGSLMFTYPSNDNKNAKIVALQNSGTSGADLVFYTREQGDASNSDGGEERFRIGSTGHIFQGTTTNFPGAGNSNSGLMIENSSGGTSLFVSRGNNIPCYINRNGDGVLISFRSSGSETGNITQSGSAVSLTGAHLSRYSQLAGNAERIEILRGTVLSNLDEMCEWGEEDNEQLNRMKISDVEGDINVAGVFQSWDNDDSIYTNDFYCAMTGDFVIRIAQGTTVERGDLLVSAGDGTAKPQDDDIIRSKTVAKVTSTTVSATYADGSYCVPCVLMAC